VKNGRATTAVAVKVDKKEIGKPSLLIANEEGCAPPKKPEFEPGQPIEQVSSVPTQMLTAPAK
jgi:hypothetical protein